MWKLADLTRIAAITAACIVGYVGIVGAQTPTPPSPSLATSGPGRPAPTSESLEVQRLGTGPVFVVSPLPSAPTAHEYGLAQVITAAFWPATILGLAFLLAFNARIGRLLGLSPKIIKKISAGGVEMEISADAVDAVKNQLRGSFGELITSADQEYKRMAQLFNLYQHLEKVTTIALPRALEENGVNTRMDDGDVRATSHVKDIVFVEHLYQIVDYYPVRRDAAGRRFSQRFGIIGRSMRLEQSLGEGEAMALDANPERSLITDWGMTKQEARAITRARPAYLAVILRGIFDDDFPIGVLFVDSTHRNKFGDNNIASNVAITLEKAGQLLALRKALTQAMAPLRLAAPNADIGLGR